MHNYKNNIKAWQSFGKHYSENSIVDQSDFHFGLCLPGNNILQFLPDLHGKTICDIGTGTGENAAYVAKHASSVTAIEISESCIELARSKYQHIQNISFIQKSWQDFTIDVFFDIVLFIGSLDYIELNDIFFHQLNKITNTGSEIIIAKMHPLWTSRYSHECGEETNSCYFKSPRIDKVYYSNIEFLRYSYSFEQLYHLFKDHGWNIVDLREPAPVPKEKAAFYMKDCYDDNVLMSRMNQIPMTLLLRFQRIN